MLSRRGFIAGAACALSLPTSAFASPSIAKRIVAIGGPVTEIMFGLGCGERIVAVDKASRFPSATRDKGDAGFYDDLSINTLLRYQPDLVIGGESVGFAEVTGALAKASVNVVTLKDIRRPDEILGRIRLAGEAIGEPGRGEALAGAVGADLAALSEDLGGITKRRRALILLGLGSGHPLIVGGAGSPAALALEMAGAENAAGHFNGWKAIRNHQVAEFEPEAIIALSMAAPLLAADISDHPALRHTSAVRESRVAVADALAFTGFGPRAAHVIAAAARSIYPDAAFRPLPQRAWVEGEPAGISL